MLRQPIYIIFSFFLFSFSRHNGEQDFIKENFQFADQQLKNMLKEADLPGVSFPRSTNSEGKLRGTNMYDWTTGFFPGSLWYAYENTNDLELKDAAIKWTETLEPLKNFTEHHDIGFMMYCSYGNAYRLTKNESYKDILIQSAKSLSTRFNKTTGCIQSWKSFSSLHDGKKYDFPVIIDNMMNLELLFFASEISGDTSFRHIAVTHALNTMKNQIRKDYSSYHVICYDTSTGKVLTKETAQGYADNSTWARGEAWGIYGFTMTYRKTNDKRFLKTAQGMADWFVNNKNLPADKIPYWDFNAGQSGYAPGAKSKALNVTTKFRDASAASITASALFELSKYSGAKGKKYKETAIQILHSLASSEYRASLGANANFLLMHSVGSIPNDSEIDVPLVYADYYFLEALHRYNLLLNGKDVVTKSK